MSNFINRCLVQNRRVEGTAHLNMQPNLRVKNRNKWLLEKGQAYFGMSEGSNSSILCKSVTEAHRTRPGPVGHSYQ